MELAEAVLACHNGEYYTIPTPANITPNVGATCQNRVGSLYEHNCTHPNRLPLTNFDGLSQIFLLQTLSLQFSYFFYSLAILQTLGGH